MLRMYNWKYKSATVKCSNCNQTFHTKSTLKRHLNSCTSSKNTTTTEDQDPPQLEIENQTECLEPVLKKIKLETLDESWSEIVAPELSEQPDVNKQQQHEQPIDDDVVDQQKKLTTKRKSNGDKSFNCSYCSYSTTLRHNLERHIRGHNDTKAYKCPFCSFSSNGRNIIKAHVSKYHRSQGEADPIEANPDQSILSTSSNDEFHEKLSHNNNVTNSDIDETIPKSQESIVIDVPPIEPKHIDEIKVEKEAVDSAPIVKKERTELLLDVNSNVVTEKTVGHKTTLTVFQTAHNLFKYNCPECPFKCNGEDLYRCHAKNHQTINTHRCPHCTFSSVKVSVRDNHLKLHKREDVYIPEPDEGTKLSTTCRCDLAQQLQCPALACHKQMECPCCHVKSKSVSFLRSHVANHLDLVIGSRFKIFDPKFNKADDLLKFACRRKRVYQESEARNDVQMKYVRSQAKDISCF